MNKFGLNWRSGTTAANPSRATRDAMARQAATAALKLRRKLAIPIYEAVCAYDAAECLGIEVRFDAIPSMEGMYVKQTLDGTAPHILISALRPTGRQAMTAGHELGHHAFGHGTRIDQYVRGVGTVGSAVGPTSSSDVASAVAEFDAEEFLADMFGAFFLMPKSAVERGFVARQVKPASATSGDVFRVAGWLGVGYAALVYHMCLSLKLIPWTRAQQLLLTKPKSLREQLLGEPITADVYAVDMAWTGRPLDLKLGDVAIVPHGTVVEPTTGRFSTMPRTPPGTIAATTRGHTVVEATSVGIGRVVGDGWAVFLRVAEREYEGRNCYRHLEAEEDDGSNEEDLVDERPDTADR